MYFAIFGGLMYIQDVAGNALIGPADGDFIIDTQRGYRFGAALGFNFSEMLGAELEVAYGRAAFDAITLLDADGVPLGDPVDLDAEDGHGTLFTVMGNLRAGFGMGAFRPYVAVGAGAAKLGIFAVGENDGGFFPNDGADDKDWTWAFQAMAGVDFAVSDNLTIGARYRFQRIGPTEFVDMDGDPITLQPFNTHGVEAVFTIHF